MDSPPCDQIRIRPLQPADARFCWTTRRRAFDELFRPELPVEIWSMGRAALQTEDFTAIARSGAVFIVEDARNRLGFFALTRPAPRQVELYLIYLVPEQSGRGIGRACLTFMEEWIRRHWPEAETLFLYTIVPGVNGGFYRRLGFTGQPVVMDYHGRPVPAVRFEKPLGRSAD
ncbi:MAG: GNAT family N-acetyltransferase [Acidobacteria bacterium]|nr:GNAT family N-acetyltransferase [Acidobacteriota bacterium]